MSRNKYYLKYICKSTIFSAPIRPLPLENLSG